MTGYSSDFLTSGEWTSVSSSNVAEARYDADREQLSIRFHSGSTYTYPGVSEEMARSFITASSHGRWVHESLVRPKWSFVKG